MFAHQRLCVFALLILQELHELLNAFHKLCVCLDVVAVVRGLLRKGDYAQARVVFLHLDSSPTSLNSSNSL